MPPPPSAEVDRRSRLPPRPARRRSGPARPRTSSSRWRAPKGAEKPKVLKAKGSKNVHSGIVHVASTFNNTIVSVCDQVGNVIGWSSSGKMGFRGSRKSTAYAAQLVAQDACRQAMAHGLKQAEVRVKGPGAGRESAVRAVQGLGIEVLRDQGCHPGAAQRLPPEKSASRLRPSAVTPSIPYLY
jgi:small subunit ribosomal protein S11